MRPTLLVVQSQSDCRSKTFKLAADVDISAVTVEDSVEVDIKDCKCIKQAPRMCLQQQYGVYQHKLGVKKMWRDRKKILTRNLSSVFPLLVSSLIPQTNLIKDLSMIFLMLSVEENTHLHTLSCCGSEKIQFISVNPKCAVRILWCVSVIGHFNRLTPRWTQNGTLRSLCRIICRTSCLFRSVFKQLKSAWRLRWKYAQVQGFSVFLTDKHNSD